MKQLVYRHWFLLALATFLFLGFVFSQPLKPLAFAATLRKCVLITVLFLMSLPLESRAIWETVRRPWAALLASIVNMGILPIVAWCFSFGLKGDMAVGLMIAAAAPCTMASAAVWTRRAGGNDTVAILVTLVTNTSCFVVTPLWLFAYIGQSIDVEMRPMIANLAVLVVLPMIVAQLVRQYRPIGTWATKHKKQLGSVAQSGILIMVLIGAIHCGLKLSATNWGEEISTIEFVLMGVAVLLLHLSVLFFGKFAAAAVGLDRQDQIAVAISGSQKTLMVGLYVAIKYFGGLTILPMVAYHIGQLVADTIIADWWNRERDE